MVNKKSKKDRFVKSIKFDNYYEQELISIIKTDICEEQNINCPENIRKKICNYLRKTKKPELGELYDIWEKLGQYESIYHEIYKDYMGWIKNQVIPDWVKYLQKNGGGKKFIAWVEFRNKDYPEEYGIDDDVLELLEMFISNIFKYTEEYFGLDFVFDNKKMTVSIDCGYNTHCYDGVEFCVLDITKSTKKELIKIIEDFIDKFKEPYQEEIWQYIGVELLFMDYERANKEAVLKKLKRVNKEKLYDIINEIINEYE